RLQTRVAHLVLAAHLADHELAVHADAETAHAGAERQIEPTHERRVLRHVVGDAVPEHVAVREELAALEVDQHVPGGRRPRVAPRRAIAVEQVLLLRIDAYGWFGGHALTAGWDPRPGCGRRSGRPAAAGRRRVASG